MALESFYGGKQGVSPVIKARFEYINTEDRAYQDRLSNETGTILTQDEFWRLKAAGIKKDDNTNYVVGETIVWNEKLLAPFTMDECFKRIDYTDVWYGELCIIDTRNKLNPNNGKIFRRTLKRYQNPNMEGITDLDSLYGEYIGQIVGPSGGIPNLDLGSLNAERQKAIGKLPTFDIDPNIDEEHPDEYQITTDNWDYAYPTNKDNKIIITTEHPEGDINKIATLKMGDGSNIEMVPGKVTDQNGNVNWNDTIEYTWCNVRRNLDNSDEDSAWIYLGFKIPYVSYNVNGYDENYTYGGKVFKDTSATQDGSKEHPFSKRYEFHIPRGARGVGPEEIFIVGKDGKTKPDPLYDFDAIQYLQEIDPNRPVVDINQNRVQRDNYYIAEGTNTVDPSSSTPSYRPKKLNSSSNEQQYIDQTNTYWVAKWILRNPKTTNEQTVYQFLGSYKDIKSIRVITNPADSDYGQMSVKYSNSNNWVNINKLPLPKKIEYVENDTQDGTILQFTMADNSIIKTDGTIREIKNITTSDDNKTWTIHYNKGGDQIVNIPVPESANVNNIKINNTVTSSLNIITASTTTTLWPLESEWWDV